MPTTERRRFNPARGGHGPGHLRSALYPWIEGGMVGDTATNDTEESYAVDWLLGQLWNCTDQLPSDVVRALSGCNVAAHSVATAVRKIKATRA